MYSVTSCVYRIDYGMVYRILYATLISSYQLQSNHRQIEAGTIQCVFRGLSTIWFQSSAPLRSVQCSCLEIGEVKFIFSTLRRREGEVGGYIPALNPQEWRMEGYNSQLTSVLSSLFQRAECLMQPFRALWHSSTSLHIINYSHARHGVRSTCNA